jgi:hypothetical protein
MSRKGNCYDNAPVESFFASLKRELVHQRSFATHEEARTAVFEWIACAEICQTSANFLLLGVEQHRQTCGVCALVCEECAKSLEGLDGMELCLETCRRCAESCR